MAEWIAILNFPELLVALAGGGALFKFLELVFKHYFGKEPSLRDELRKDMARLSESVKELERKVDSLEQEIETWKGKVEEWRNKYYNLWEKFRVLQVVMTEKDHTINTLRSDLQKCQREIKELKFGDYGDFVKGD